MKYYEIVLNTNKNKSFAESYYSERVNFDIKSDKKDYVLSLPCLKNYGKLTMKGKSVIDESGKVVAIVNTSNRQDYPCLGGEFDGLKKDFLQVKNKDYIMYNLSAGNRDVSSAIFVHRSILEKYNES